MRLHHYLLLLLTITNSTVTSAAIATEAQWFVAVYSEHFQHITGASTTPNVRDGVFLKPEIKSKVIYVRSKKGYELNQFRPSNTSADSMTNSASSSTISVATDSAVEHSKEEKLTSEFGPLPDTGVQYYLNGDTRGWSCAKLFVQPMPNDIVRLRCEKDMVHQ